MSEPPDAGRCRSGHPVFGIVELAGLKRQAAAADAAVEPVPEPLEHGDALIEMGAKPRLIFSQSRFVGVRSSGNCLSWVRISSSEKPIFWAIRMKDSRRMSERMNIRLPPGVRRAETRPSSS
jgi:hypothetical protein